MTILPIKDWKRIFIDTSFIIDLLSTPTAKAEADRVKRIENAKKLLDEISKREDNSVRWLVSSITLSELTKFEDEDIREGVMDVLRADNIEIINFTSTEANFLVNKFNDFLPASHVSQYASELKKELAKVNAYAPKNLIDSDMRIISCAKSRAIDALITSDIKTFLPVACKVQLPVIHTMDLPLDMYGNLDISIQIAPNY